MSVIIEIVASGGGSLVAGLVAVEAAAWTPRITTGLLDRAVRRLPAHRRQRFGEEWEAHLRELPTAMSRLLVAIGFVCAAHKISWQERPKRMAPSQAGRRKGSDVFAQKLLARMLRDSEFVDARAAFVFEYKERLDKEGRDAAEKWRDKQRPKLTRIAARALAKSFFERDTRP